jgi:hypothetical protein
MPRGRPAFIPVSIPEPMGHQKRRPCVGRSHWRTISRSPPDEVSRALDCTVSAGEETHTLQGVADLIAAGVHIVQPDIVKMGRHHRAHAVRRALPCALFPHQTQPDIGHAANMHLLATMMNLAKPVEVADNPRRLNASTPQSRRTAHSRCRRDRVSVSNSRSSSRASSGPDAGPPITDLRLLRHGMARRSDVHPTSVTAGTPTTGIADGPHLGIRNEAMEREQRHGPTDRNARALCR